MSGPPKNHHHHPLHPSKHRQPIVDRPLIFRSPSLPLLRFNYMRPSRLSSDHVSPNLLPASQMSAAAMATTGSPPTDRLPLRKRFGNFFKRLTTPRAAVVRTRARAPYVLLLLLFCDSLLRSLTCFFLRLTDARSRNDQFHYVISSVQEDEIRESFLVEKLRGYTQVSCLK